jgi:hypothetical protein
MAATVIGDAIMGADFSVDDWVGNELGTFIGNSIKQQVRHHYQTRELQHLDAQDMHQIGELDNRVSPHTRSSHDEAINTLRGKGEEDQATGAQAPSHNTGHSSDDYDRHISHTSANWVTAYGNVPSYLETQAQLYQKWYAAYGGNAGSETAPQQVSVGQRMLDTGSGLLWSIDSGLSAFGALITSETVVGGMLLGANSVYAGDHAQAAFREAYTGHVVDTGGVQGLTKLLDLLEVPSLHLVR